MMGRKPAEVKRRVPKALAWDQRLLPFREPLTWDEVVRAAWDEPVMELQLPDGPYRLVIERPGNIPQVVNERVKASVVVQHHVPLRGDKGVRIVARRRPGTTDVTWRVTFDAGLDHRDAVLRAEADAALQDLRTTLGL